MGRPKKKPSEVKIFNGCRWHNDCFTCPLPDCTANGSDVYEGGKVNWTNPEQVRAYKTEKQREYRLEKLKKEFPHLDFEEKEKAPSTTAMVKGAHEK